MKSSIIKLLPMLLLLLCNNMDGQVAKNAIEKINGYKNISYTSLMHFENITSSEITTHKIRACFTNNPIDVEIGGLFQLTTDSSIINYDGNKFYFFDLKDSTYWTSNKDKSRYYTQSLYFWMNILKKALIANPTKILELKDSIIQGKQCFHIRIVRRDTIIDAKRRFYFEDLFLDKTSFLPIYTRSEMSSRLGNMDTHQIIDNTFADYRINPNTFPDLSKIPDVIRFKEKVSQSRALLSKNNKAPSWKLISTDNDTLSLEKLKGKIVLIDFTANYCGHCIESISCIERLRKKYSNSEVAIVTINCADDKRSIQKFIQKQNITMPIFMDGKTVASEYNVKSLPTFYLLNRQGYIEKAFMGFYPEREREFINEIDRLRISAKE